MALTKAITKEVAELSNIETARAAYRAFGGGDLAALMALTKAITKEVAELSNIETARAAYRAFGGGDLAALTTLNKAITKEVAGLSNIETARAAYRAFGSGDLAALKEIYAPDAVWYSSDEVKPGGEVHGRDAIIEMMTRLPDHWSTVSVEPRKYIDGGEYVVVLGTQHFANDKGSEESPFVNVLKFNRHGRVVRGEFHADSAKIARLQD